MNRKDSLRLNQINFGTSNHFLDSVLNLSIVATHKADGNKQTFIWANVIMSTNLKMCQAEKDF